MQKKDIWCVVLLLVGFIFLGIGCQSTIIDSVLWFSGERIALIKNSDPYKFMLMLKDLFLSISGAVFGAAIAIKLDLSGVIEEKFRVSENSLKDFIDKFDAHVNCSSKCCSDILSCLDGIQNDNVRYKNDIINHVLSIYNDGLGSKESDIVTLKEKKIYIYMITVTKNSQSGVWVCYSANFVEKTPRCLTAQITSQNTGFRVVYDVELFVRKNHLVLAIVANNSQEKASTVIFPDFSLNYSNPSLCGIRVGNAYDGNYILGASIISFEPIAGLGEGIITGSGARELDEIWSEGFFKRRMFDVSTGKKADAIAGCWIAKAYSENGVEDVAFVKFNNTFDQEVIVEAVVVNTDGIFINCNFNSTSSKVDDNKLIVTYQRPNDQGSLGVAVYYFDNIVDNKYSSYVGHFTDDNTPYHTIRVAGVRISEALFNKVSNCYTMKHKVNMAMFSEELSMIPDQHEQEAG